MTTTDGVASTPDDDRFGVEVPWIPGPLPVRAPIQGRTVRVEPLSVERHLGDLFAAVQGADAIWDYLGYGPFSDEVAFRAHLEGQEASRDPLFFAVIDRATGKATGVASLMRLDPANGVGEVGHIWFGPALQRTIAATEAIYLLGRHLMTDFEYRRFEWKCHDRNRASRRAAERFGFTYEGTFRNHMVSKGRNRDTAWFSITDAEWPAIQAGFETWLDPANFDDHGHQRRTLEECRHTVP